MLRQLVQVSQSFIQPFFVYINHLMPFILLISHKHQCPCNHCRCRILSDSSFIYLYFRKVGLCILEILEDSLPQILVIRIVLVPIRYSFKIGRSTRYGFIHVRHIFEKLLQSEMSKSAKKQHFTHSTILHWKIVFGNRLHFLDCSIASLDNLIRNIPREINRPAIRSQIHKGFHIPPSVAAVPDAATAFIRVVRTKRTRPPG